MAGTSLRSRVDDELASWEGGSLRRSGSDRGSDTLGNILLGALAVTALYIFKQELPQLKRYLKMETM